MLPPADPPVRNDTDAVFLVQRDAGSHLWYVNSYMRHRFEVDLQNVPNERTCRSRLVEFSAPQGAVAATPLSAPTVRVTPDWVRSSTGAPVCRAGVRWRLGEIPGQQTLNARLVRNDKATLSDTARTVQLASGVVEWTASAHTMPALVAGFSYAVGPNPQPLAKADTLLGRRGQPFFGAEFSPLALSGSGGLARVSEHVRVTAGTNLRSPGRDFYLGLNPIVLVDGLRTTPFPIQSVIGYRRVRRQGSFVVGATANASAILGTFLGNVLTPGAK